MTLPEYRSRGSHYSGLFDDAYLLEQGCHLDCFNETIGPPFVKRFSPMLLTLSQPLYQDHIGRLQILDGSQLWNVFVTTGAIERLSRSEANDESLAMTAEAIEAIARRKLKSGQTMADRIWIRSLDL